MAYYCGDQDKWEEASGDPLPAELAPPFVVASWDAKLFVISRGLVSVVATIRPESAGSKPAFSAAWSKPKAVCSLKHLTPDTCQFLLV